MDCVFCKIVAGDIPTEKVRETDMVLAFRDVSPSAPVHVLVIPKKHYANVDELAEADPAALLAVHNMAREVARDEAGGSYRLIFNTGEAAGQSVFHVHGHVLAGFDNSAHLGL